MILRVAPHQVLTLVIDDTLVPRKSREAPGSAIRHDHSKRDNRPEFLTAQCWLTLALEMVQVLRPALSGRVRVLFDCWFMRARLVLPLLT
jgi:hypothetical protein